MAISDWSTVADDNTTIDGINIDENCPPSNVNNAMRAIMAGVAGGDFPDDAAILTLLAEHAIGGDAIPVDSISGNDLNSVDTNRLDIVTSGVTANVPGAGTWLVSTRVRGGNPRFQEARRLDSSRSRVTWYRNYHAGAGGWNSWLSNIISENENLVLEYTGDGGITVRTLDGAGSTYIFQVESGLGSPRLTVEHGAPHLNGTSAGWTIGGNTVIDTGNLDSNISDLPAGTTIDGDPIITVYTGGDGNETNFPIGHMILSDDTDSPATNHTRNSQVNVSYKGNDAPRYRIGTGSDLSGTWRVRGGTSHEIATDNPSDYLVQRVV